MSIQAVAWVLDQSQARGYARLVLISLANHHNGGTGQCNPGQRRIAQEAGISPGSVPAQIRTLVDLGEVVIADPGGSHRTARYELPFAQQPSESTLDSSPSTLSRGRSTRGPEPRGTVSNHEPSGLDRQREAQDRIFAANEAREAEIAATPKTPMPADVRAALNPETHKVAG